MKLFSSYMKIIFGSYP